MPAFLKLESMPTWDSSFDLPMLYGITAEKECRLNKC
jgi:hypothetical protein